MNKKKKFQKQKLIPVAVIAVLILIWQAACSFGWVPKFMLPSPADVIKAFVTDFPLLMSHARVTLLEACLGLVIGV